jgi:LPXTG-site transpeptidase (sortase) family protein
LAGTELNSARFYGFTGRLLLSTGVVLGSLLGVRFARESLDTRIAAQPRYLSIDSTPVFQLPPATALATLTSTALPPPTPTLIPTATPTPLPQPVKRLAIPAIGLNTSVRESLPVQVIRGGRWVYQWDPPAYAAGHYNSSGNPGEGRNIVFEGHNNMAGEVFRDLNLLSEGDEIILFNDIGEFHYLIQQKMIIPYVGHEDEANAQLIALTGPQSSEMVTLISCWPYATFTSRIVVIALPVPGGGG